MVDKFAHNILFYALKSSKFINELINLSDIGDMRKYVYQSKKTIMRNPMRVEIMHSIRLAQDDFKSTYFNSYDGECFSIEELLQEQKNFNMENVEIVGLNNTELCAIVKANYSTLKTICIISNEIDDLTCFRGCNALKSVSFVGDCKKLELWNFCLTPNITALKLELPKCEKLLDFNCLSGSSLKELYIAGYSRKVPDLTLFTLDNVCALKTISGLEQLSLYCNFSSDKLELLSLFSSLKNIKSLNLPNDLFTFNQFAWLSSKLEQVKGLGPILSYYADRSKDVTMFTVVGYDQPDVQDELPIIESFNKLKVENKDKILPPAN